MKRKWTVTLWIIGALVALYAGMYVAFLPRYSYVEKKLPDRFEDFYNERLAESTRLGVRPGNEEKLLRISPGKTPLALLYVHGWTASRAEGEAVMDRAARRAGANIYYLRLAGHGVDGETMARSTYRDWLDSATDALRMMGKLGNRTVIAGTSMGGTIAVWLAARYPDLVDGVIICSPFFDSVNPVGRILEYPGGLQVLELLMGKVMMAKTGPNHVEGWQDYWIVERHSTVYKTMFDLKKLVARDDIYRLVRDPVLLLYYYRDEQHQDTGASVPAMLHAFKTFGPEGKPHPLNRSVAIADGDHVLMSRWTKSDKRRVEEACVAFLQAVAKSSL
jgi:esterase/lipase